MFFPTSHIASLLSEHRSVWTQLAPSAKGCVSLYVLHGPPDPPYQHAVIVT